MSVRKPQFDGGVGSFGTSSKVGWHYAFYELEQPVDERVGDAEAEQAARLERRGLWVDEAPAAPWDFRRMR